MSDLTPYAGLLAEIKGRIQLAQTRAVLAVNGELIRLYWQIGQLLDERQATEGWGAGVIPGLARDIRNELPEQKGFSERNLKRMLAFYRAYRDVPLGGPGFVPQAVAPAALGVPPPAKVQQAVAQIDDTLLTSVPWGHHVLLLERVKDRAMRGWYMAHVMSNGWSRNVLTMQIDTQAHARQGKLPNNFMARLPAPQSDLVQQALKDPYAFDFRATLLRGAA